MKSIEKKMSGIEREIKGGGERKSGRKAGREADRERRRERKKRAKMAKM